MTAYMLYLRDMSFVQIFRPHPGGRINPIHAAVVGGRKAQSAATTTCATHAPGRHKRARRRKILFDPLRQTFEHGLLVNVIAAQELLRRRMSHKNPNARYDIVEARDIARVQDREQPELTHELVKRGVTGGRQRQRRPATLAPLEWDRGDTAENLGERLLIV